MPYRSRHVRPFGGGPPFSQYSAATREALRNTPLEKNEEEKAQIAAMRSRGCRNQEEGELFEKLLRNEEERCDNKQASLAREIESYFANRDLSPLPPPLPKSSQWLDIELPSQYKFPDRRVFYVACEQGNMDVVMHWVNHKKEGLLQLGLEDGLACAAASNQVAVCSYLLDVAGTRIHGQVIRKACANRSLALFELFIQHGYHPNQQIPSNHGFFGTALCHCLDDDNITRLLLENGADPNVAPFKDRRCAPWSIRSAPPMDRKSGLPLDIAIAKSSVAVVRMLLSHGADPSFSRPFCSLMWQRCPAMELESRSEWRTRMDVLMEHGANVNGKTYGGGTALSAAVYKQRWDIVEYLLEHGSDPTIQTPCTGKDPLTKAAEAAELSWEFSNEMQEYISYLFDSINGAEPEQEMLPPETASQNPLVQVMETVKKSKRQTR